VSTTKTTESTSHLEVVTTTLPVEAKLITSTVVFDRERMLLYVAAMMTVALVSAYYYFGYLQPAQLFGDSITDGANANSSYPVGCYLLFREHANRIQSAYSIRFLGMLMGMLFTFIGMMFTIKGLEAGYSLGLKSGEQGASLKTASPGLVLCTLGIAMCAAATLHTTDLTFSMTESCLR
jgi:hypothetical protein